MKKLTLIALSILTFSVFAVSDASAKTSYSHFDCVDKDGKVTRVEVKASTSSTRVQHSGGTMTVPAVKTSGTVKPHDGVGVKQETSGAKSKSDAKNTQDEANARATKEKKGKESERNDDGSKKYERCGDVVDTGKKRQSNPPKEMEDKEKTEEQPKGR